MIVGIKICDKNLIAITLLVKFVVQLMAYLDGFQLCIIADAEMSG